MKSKYLNELQKANTLFKEEKIEEAALAYSDIVTELLILDQEVEIAEIAMQLAINAYSQVEHDPEEGLYSHYFSVVRHMDDHKEIIDTDFLNEPIAPNYGNRNIFTYEPHDIHHSHKQIGPYQVFSIEAQGPRDEMEDSHIETELTLDDKKAQLFAVLDGHGGSSCAQFVKKHLKKMLLKHLKELDDLSIANTLSKICIELDSEWKKSFKDRSGCTLSGVLIIDRDLWVFNVGDSRVVLANGEHPIQLSEDAKPPKFEKELIRRGSFVRNSRVEGALDVARTIGDIEHPAVSARPTIRKFPLGSKHYTLIIACDGLWDVVGTEEAAKHCSQYKDIVKMGKSLKELAFHYGTTDNVTITLVSL